MTAPVLLPQQAARASRQHPHDSTIDAARELDLPVIMIARPELPDRPQVESVAEIMQWLGHRTDLGA